MAKLSPVESDNEKKIGGYDGWEVRSAGSTLRDAEKIKNDPKFLKVVLVEMDKEADKTEKAAKQIRTTVSGLKIRKKKLTYRRKK